MKSHLVSALSIQTDLTYDHADARPYNQRSVGTKTAKTHKERARSKAAAKSRRAQRKARK